MSKLNALKSFDVSNIGIADYVILSCASQIGLFEWLQNRKVDFETVLNSFPNYDQMLKSLLYSLVSYGYLELIENRLSINPIFEELLIGEQSRVLKNYDWYFLIAQAPSLINNNKKPSISSETYTHFINISESLSREALPFIEHDFPELLLSEKVVLDLGCGRMGLFRTFLEKNEKLSITGVEQNDQTLRFLRETIKNKKLHNKIKIIEEDVLDAVQWLDGKYDFIFLSHLIHWVDKDRVPELLSSCKKLLKDNGNCVIYEDYLANNHVEPQSSVRKNLSLTIMGYQIFTEEETRYLLKEAGFNRVSSRIVADRRVLFYCN